MGRLIWNQDGRTNVRTAPVIQHYDARGRMHPPQPFDGTLILISGDRNRVLRWFADQNPTKQAGSAFSVLNLLMFAAGAASMTFWSLLWATT